MFFKLVNFKSVSYRFPHSNRLIIKLTPMRWNRGDDFVRTQKRNFSLSHYKSRRLLFSKIDVC